eukprot:TRINITY_DN1910_c0_g1_i1.p1 TRINITY_DN1910_c0_g1~~TRINITY_DN1910_c0_g1_i1.p1  ORF type:complete len:327 (-),score=16.72 TRINITY_DN1910_c0_g1_i1:181-1161(-)
MMRHKMNYGSIVNLMTLTIIVVGQSWCQICLMTRVRTLASVMSCRVVEWAEYHLQLGVDQIYIANDCSRDSIWTDILNDIRHDRVEIISSFRNCYNERPDENKIFSHMFKTRIVGNCTWAGVMDMDEFMTFQDSGKNLLSQLENFAHPAGFLRMPWWVMSSHGLLKRYPGFWIDTFRVGWMEKWVKTFARVDVLKDWANTHYPVLNMENEQLYATEDLHVEESRQLGDTTERIPANGIFIKHFRFLSWEEFLLQKAKYNQTSEGLDNPWGVAENRVIWESMSIKPHARLIYHDFTLEMSIKLRKSMSSVNRLSLRGCEEVWGLDPW